MPRREGAGVRQADLGESRPAAHSSSATRCSCRFTGLCPLRTDLINRHPPYPSHTSHNTFTPYTRPAWLPGERLEMSHSGVSKQPLGGGLPWRWPFSLPDSHPIRALGVRHGSPTPPQVAGALMADQPPPYHDAQYFTFRFLVLLLRLVSEGMTVMTFHRYTLAQSHSDARPPHPQVTYTLTHMLPLLIKPFTHYLCLHIAWPLLTRVSGRVSVGRVAT